MDTRESSAGFAPHFRRLLEIRSYETPYAFTLTFTQGKVRAKALVQNPLGIAIVVSSVDHVCVFSAGAPRFDGEEDQRQERQ